MKQKLSIVVTIAAVLAFIGSGIRVSAETPLWSNPIPLSVSANTHDYRILTGLGGVTYYRLTVSAPTQHRVTLSIPRSASKKFAPQIVLFEPSEETYGPLLPIAQPPQTLALVYPRTQPRIVFDATTQILSTVSLEATIRFRVAGTYLLAVYNADTESGEYKLTMNPSDTAVAWSDAFVYPKTWIQDQMFAGFGWLTLITPMVLLLMGWLVYMRLDHHRLHPHKIYTTTKPTGTQKTPPQVMPLLAPTPKRKNKVTVTRKKTAVSGTKKRKPSTKRSTRL